MNEKANRKATPPKQLASPEKREEVLWILTEEDEQFLRSLNISPD